MYLSTGLSVILAFIGIKLILTFFHEVNPAIPHVPTMISLAVILGVLAVTTVASLLAARRDPTLRAHAGNLRGHQLHRQPEDTGATTQHDSARR